MLCAIYFSVFQNLHIGYVCINEIYCNVAYFVFHLGHWLYDLRIGVRFLMGAKNFPFVNTCIPALKPAQHFRGAQKLYIIHIFRTETVR